MAASTPASQPPRMLLNPGIDEKDAVEEKMLKNYQSVKESMNGLSDRDINDVLLKQAHAGQHDSLQLGLLYGILVDQQTGSEHTYYRHMMACCRDAGTLVAQRLGVITFEKWTKLTDFSQGRLLWTFRVMVNTSVAGTEPIYHNLLRQIAGGDVSPRNLMLIDKMLDILNENRAWLDKLSNMQANAMAVYTFLRVLADLVDYNLSSLRTKVAVFCSALLTSRWVESMAIGRDLIRLLQAVARVPEMDSVWKTLISDPKSLSPTFTGIVQIMSIKTPKRFLVLRLTPEMENKLVYLTTKVKFGNHKRYQDWFQRQYLSTPESQTLRNDLIRFICAVIHPTNDMLNSDIIPRWAIIGWLLATCTSNAAAATAKLALFWDWLFYDKDKENNIMNIEPAILVMQHSLKAHLQITVSLLDFLCRIIPTFHPSMQAHVKSGIQAALSDISVKKVLPSLSALFDSAKLDRELRTSLRENFPQFCMQVSIPADVGPTGPASPQLRKDSLVTKAESPLDALIPLRSPLDSPLQSPLTMAILQAEQRPSSPPSEDTGFSDEEMEVTKKPHTLSSPAHFKPIEVPKPIRRQSSAGEKKRESLDDYISKVNGDMRNILDQLKAESDMEKRCELTEKLLQCIDEVEDFDPLAPAVGSALCLVFHPFFTSVSLPQEINDESLEDSIVSPIFVIFRYICSLPMDEPTRDVLTYLLYEMHSFEQRVGYLLLYYLKIGKSNDDKMQTYKAMANCASDEKDLKTFILDDLKLCQEDDMKMFIFLIPDLYSNFPSATATNSELMHLICSTIDGTQLLELMCQILQGHLLLFKKDSVLAVLNHSLEWETIEQYFLWQLLMSHDLPAEHILPVLPKLEFPKHAEAISSLLSLLKQKSPNNDLMRLCLCRHPSRQDLFTTSILKHWAKEDEDKTAECLAHFFTVSLGTPKKAAKHNRAKKEMPTVENILLHLDYMRLTCKNISFLTNEAIRNSLQQVQQTSNEIQKQKFSELFALIMDEDEEEQPSKRNLRQTAARRANNASPKLNAERRKRASDSSSDSDDEELRSQPAKKKKKGNVIELDDSD